MSDVSAAVISEKKSTIYLPPKYKSQTAMRVAIVALLAIGLAVGFLALQGKLLTLPQDAVQWFRSVNWVKAAVGASAFFVLAVGACLIIDKVRHTKDPITQTWIGSTSGDESWQPIAFIGKFNEAGYIDLSTLDKKGNGKAYIYGYKDCSNHYNVSLVIPLVTPLYAVCAIVYNILRMVVIPFYILYRVVADKCRNQDHGFKLSLIPKEVGNSLLRMVQAPFYATALIFASLYSWFKPMEGRLLGALIEKSWNDGMMRNQGFWSVAGGQSQWHGLEGQADGAQADRLGKNGFFLAGCWQPRGVAIYQNGICQETGYNLSAFCSENGEISSKPSNSLGVKATVKIYSSKESAQLAAPAKAE